MSYTWKWRSIAKVMYGSFQKGVLLIYCNVIWHIISLPVQKVPIRISNYSYRNSFRKFYSYRNLNFLWEIWILIGKDWSSCHSHELATSPQSDLPRENVHVIREIPDLDTNILAKIPVPIEMKYIDQLCH
jgi:hypothetical protein